jgi:hypothetical protein
VLREGEVQIVWMNADAQSHERLRHESKAPHPVLDATHRVQYSFYLFMKCDEGQGWFVANRDRLLGGNLPLCSI